MNKNQRQIRKVAAETSTGATFNVHHQYDKTCDQGKTTASSFVRRSIPHGTQPRLSKKAKVGRP